MHRYAARVLVYLTLLASLNLVSTSHGQVTESLVESVELQPLLSQVGRLQEAMEYVGSPLSQATQDGLVELDASQPAPKSTRTVQELLDPYCLAIVTIAKDGSVHTQSGSAAPELLQEGWRTFLVKVINQAELGVALHVSSPNAGDKPGADAEEVQQRWLDVSMFDGRPMTPRLSGLELEYRILQIYSSIQGSREGTIEFTAIGASQDKNRSDVLQEWDFETDLAGWESSGAKLNEGIVTLSSVSGPAFLQTLSPRPDLTGKLELRFWLKSPVATRGSVLWANGPVAKGQFGQAAFSIKAGVAREYRVLLDVEEALSGFRLVAPSGSSVDWIRLSRRSQRRDSPAAITATFENVSATPVTLSVIDAQGQPTTAAFLVRGSDGHIYPTQSKRLAPDFFFHPQVYRHDGETLDLPPGEYTIVCSRGPESVPQTRQLTVGKEALAFEYNVERWVDPAALGWYSGDHHIHAAGCAHYQNPTQGVHAIDMARHCQGEDLKVGCNLTWGPCFDYQKQFFTGQVAEASKYPYLLRYDVEVSGFGSHVSGHLCLLRLQEQIYPGGESKDHWPTLGLSTLKWAKAQGAICGPAHSSAGLQVSDARVEGVSDGPPLPGWRRFGGPRAKVVLALPNYFIPQYNGIGANEYIVDITHEVPGPDGTLVSSIDFISSMNTDRVAEWNMWYHTLNCGFRVKTSGETDFPCVTGERVGIGRVYVKVKDRLNYDDWCQGISEGRSYVSDGTAHLMDLTASSGEQAIAVGENGSELKLAEPAEVVLKVQAAVRKPGQESTEIELIHNGYPVDIQTISADGTTQSVEFRVEPVKSGWLAIRAGASAHTNPIFVIVDDKPIRASVASAEWCLQGVDQCWKMKQPSYAESEQEAAAAAYDHAREVYRTILKEAHDANL